MAAKSILIECLEDIALDIIQAEKWLSSYDDLSVDTNNKIAWEMTKYENELNLDELERSVKLIYEEMMTAREPYEGIEWECLSITMLAGFLAGFWSEDDE
jgi:hypothetical protein